MKIVQISASKFICYGLGDDNKLYVWSYEDGKWVLDKNEKEKE